MLSTAFWMQDDHRATTEAVGNALDSQPRQRNYCPSLFPAQWPLGRILGTTRRWLISGRFFTYKFGAHPAEAASDFAALMARVRAGAEVIIENGARPVAGWGRAPARPREGGGLRPRSFGWGGGGQIPPKPPFRGPPQNPG